MYCTTRFARLRRLAAARLLVLLALLEASTFRLAGLPPLVGGSPEGDGAGDGGGDGGGDGAAQGASGDDDGAQGAGAENEGDGDGDGEGDGDDDFDAEATRRQIAEMQARLDERDRREAEAARKAREESGDFEKLYREEREAREKLEAKIERTRVEGYARDELANAKAINTATALRALDLEQITDAASARRAVQALRESDPYLFTKTRRQAASVGTGSGSGSSGGAAQQGERKNNDQQGTRSPVDRLAAGYAQSAGSR